MCLTCLALPLSLTDRKLHILARPAESDGSREAAPRWPGLEEVDDEAESSPAPPDDPKYEAPGSSNILAYVSVLAAVVLGLLIYVAYKW